MRRLALATVSAALVTAVAVVVPSGIAHSAPTVLPDAISGRCAANDSANCWRYITFNDVASPTPDPPEVQGNKLILNHAGKTVAVPAREAGHDL